MDAQTLRTRFANGPLVVGGHVFFTDPSITEQMACMGYDFIWIDAEHGAFDRHTILTHIMAAKSGGAAAVVRVVENSPAVIKPILEMGPDGIIIPQICSAQAAYDAISACRYPPAGIRGFGPRRANRYGSKPTSRYIAEAEDSMLRIVQIEHVDAVREIDAILAVDGLDAVIIGPNDLSGSIGKLGNLWDPEVLSLCDTVLSHSKIANKPCGISLGPQDTDYRDRWIRQGIDFISCGDDLNFIAMGAKLVLSALR
ncbi:MAG: 4-hydroxy-3-methylbut-2-en-1-yl diphosphate synthase [Spirochaetae bacterium HGW-Spirochaetae-4]|jgi:2-dehydro-3-deoxyglucarate aldolase/4-hydroxy-2-oxoheptanedioate aldolase|nr:MAG: 4-hydroxy-3-methylbut-2-en-1-yl diphosphate synthase [Spirochaetes bacterium GWC2_52_13]PKL12413.1 MAG: 4-hydroxy-3-methylbut-2-en-1-yl diphosphate synthase [Spirochaetae bacterium HGW-Spirochaetae-8]PKL20849.1 MAG: 4-hydroxy-3-methylbut-2-en-1-yl diphosphate synthase [Spirochaetae bacterium HGW-Spirochaetae-4]HCG62746.1 4-hydroxy-3-methylbut-2-en-1-yl diphosphate synthase [Sphaerochaeta sp.]HCS36867.1 4-hydroxy-3-methylbut-2-en-1-yl diphosphate synthase [Sphaerochaeta sp.]